MSARKVGLTLMAAALIAGCGSSRTRQINEAARLSPATVQAVAEPAWMRLTEPAGEYRAGPGDLLEITIYRLYSMSEPTHLRVRLDEEGRATLPLIGPVQLASLTLSEIEQKLTAAYSPRFIINPNISVTMAEYRTWRVMVTGEVNAPGIYQLNRQQRNVLQAILKAGGLTDKAKYQVRLLRATASQFASNADNRLREAASGWPDNSLQSAAATLPQPVGSTQYVISLEQDKNGRLDERATELMLQDGDVLVVDQDHRRAIYVYGLVRQPGQFELKRNETVTVLQALAMAGGLDERLSITHAILTKGTQTARPKSIRLNLAAIAAGKAPNPTMEAGDVLEVPHTMLTRVQMFLINLFRFNLGAAMPL